MKDCNSCAKLSTCTRDAGIIFGGCNVEYTPKQPEYTKTKPLDIKATQKELIKRTSEEVHSEETILLFLRYAEEIRG